MMLGVYLPIDGKLLAWVLHAVGINFPSIVLVLYSLDERKQIHVLIHAWCPHEIVERSLCPRPRLFGVAANTRANNTGEHSAKNRRNFPSHKHKCSHGENIVLWLVKTCDTPYCFPAFVAMGHPHPHRALGASKQKGTCEP